MIHGIIMDVKGEVVMLARWPSARIRSRFLQYPTAGYLAESALLAPQLVESWAYEARIDLCSRC